MKTIIVNKNDEGSTIFSFIKKVYKNTSLSIIYKWFRKGDIKLNGKRIKDTKIKIMQNDEVTVYDSSLPVKRNNFKYLKGYEINIIYEDENILIVDKPAGLEVHSPINPSLDDIVKSYLFDKKEYDPNLENSFVVSHIHRIDKLTQGLIIYAKNKIALEYFNNNINNKNEIIKIYIARLDSEYKGPNRINGFIKVDNFIKKSVFRLKPADGFKECSMDVKIIGENLVEIILLTGRKHQIRCAMNFYKCPIKFDYKYSSKYNTQDLAISLVAKKIKFNNITGHFDYLNGQEFTSKYNV